ncbi:MAG: hypothetical protein AABX47_08790 [Nanoarchaeota archaeon]
MATCSICGSGIDGKSTVCAACGVTYHIDCWGYNGGCATFGCGSDKRDDALDKPGGKGDDGSMSGLELTVSSASSPTVPEENDFVKRFIEPVYQDIVTLLEGTPNRDKTDHELLYKNAIRRVMSPPVVLRRLEKIRSDWIGHYRIRLEERCGQDPNFQLVKEDPDHILALWKEFEQYFSPARKSRLGRMLDKRPKKTDQAVEERFREMININYLLRDSLQIPNEQLTKCHTQRLTFERFTFDLCHEEVGKSLPYSSTISVAGGLVVGLAVFCPMIGVLLLTAGAAVPFMAIYQARRYPQTSIEGQFYSARRYISYPTYYKLKILFQDKNLLPGPDDTKESYATAAKCFPKTI